MKNELVGTFYGTDEASENAKFERIVKVAADTVEKTRASVATLQAELHELKDIYDVDEKETVSWEKAGTKTHSSTNFAGLPSAPVRKDN